MRLIIIPIIPESYCCVLFSDRYDVVKFQERRILLVQNWIVVDALTRAVILLSDDQPA